jgi:NAD(P)-dependent dehydrogenase (short-subunit alcohol dehydrogenase family)
VRTFDDKVVAITGAAPGIGRALALELAGHGAVLRCPPRRRPGVRRLWSTAPRSGRRDARLLALLVRFSGAGYQRLVAARRTGH